MKTVNLLAAPGTGKSVTGQVLSGLLSLAGYRVEYVPEFAKFAHFANNQAALADQIYMFGKQENRLKVLSEGDLDFVVMDGPLPLALLYTPDNYYRHYEPLVIEVFKSFDNVNFFLPRNQALPYKRHGRTQDVTQALALEQRLLDILKRHSIDFTTYQVDPQLPFRLFKALTGHVAPALEAPTT